MSDSSLPISTQDHLPAPEPSAIWRVAHRTEDWLLGAALLAVIVLPLAEAVLRKFLQTGISGASAILQHFTLVIGMLGGALAARESRLLSLSTADQYLKGTPQRWARLFAHAIGSLISLWLAIASIRFVITEREASTLLAYGIPVWCVQCVLPLGFGLVTLRLLWHASETWRGRLIAFTLLLACLGLTGRPPTSPDQLLWPAVLLLLLAVGLGTPVFAALGGAALIAFWMTDVPIASIPLTHYSLVTNPTLPTIPLFTLAGYFLAEGGASRRLIRVFNALFGQMRGGPAVVATFVCAFFTSFTGASGVTILALGGLLMPILRGAGYAERPALGLLTGSGSLGLLFPPCLPLILYAVAATANAPNAGITIERMFLGGIGPGLLMLAMTAWWGMRAGPPRTESARAFDWPEARQALWDAKWELAVPVVALFAMFSGIATPVEAAAVTAAYALAVETIIHRDLTFSRLPGVLKECGLLVGGVLLILGVALGFTNFLIDAQVPTRAVEWVTANISNRYLFLIALNVFLLVVGCLMDIYSAIVVVVPLLLPLGQAYQIDPIHLGIVFLANLELGFLTPPVGMNLFLASYRFQKPIPEIVRSILPVLFVRLIGVMAITYLPPLTTLLPHWLTR